MFGGDAQFPPSKKKEKKSEKQQFFGDAPFPPSKKKKRKVQGQNFFVKGD